MEGAVIAADPSEKGYNFARGVYEFIRNKEERKFSLDFADIRKTTFKDGEFKLKIVRNIREHRVYLIHDPNMEANKYLSNLWLTLQGAASSSPSKMTVVLPYMRYSRQDRKDESRVSVNAKAICDVMAMYAQGAISIDLHAPQIQEYPPSNFSFDNLSSAPVVAEHLERNHKSLLEKLTLVSPDLGGGKRLEIYEKALVKKKHNPHLALGHKKGNRKRQEVEEVIIIGDVEGRDCLIIDDIIDTGSTMVQTEKKLRKKGAKSVWAYGTFGLFTSGIEMFKDFDGLMTSDVMNTKNHKTLEVISLVGLFGEAIYRSHVGESLSSLFE
jgi:ribose-phosphate pyrophosphokinase